MKNETFNFCPTCLSEEIVKKNYSGSFFRHQDFDVLYNAGNFATCRACGSLFFEATGEKAAEINQIYQGLEYIRNKKTPHVDFENTNSKNITSTYMTHSKVILDLYGKKPNRVLDIGTFNGNFLEAMNELDASAEYHGFDMVEEFKEIFPAKFQYHYGSLDQIDGKFDVLVALNVILYIDSLPEFLIQLNRMMDNDSIFYLDVPDIEKNPQALLFGDQFNYFMRENLTNIFASKGFSFEPINNPWSARTISGIARKNDSAKISKNIAEASLTKFDNSYEYLVNINKKFIDFTKDGKPFHIFGLTINASILYHLLENKPDFKGFIDENPNKVGKEFFGQKIKHPSDINKDEAIVVSYGKTNQLLKEKLESNYKVDVITI